MVDWNIWKENIGNLFDWQSYRERGGEREGGRGIASEGKR